MLFVLFHTGAPGGKPAIEENRGLLSRDSDAVVCRVWPGCEDAAFRAGRGGLDGSCAVQRQRCIYVLNLNTERLSKPEFDRHQVLSRRQVSTWHRCFPAHLQLTRAPHPRVA